NSEEGKLIMDMPDFTPEYIPVSLEHLKAYNFLLASKLQWTFVCPPDIIDAAATGIYTTNVDYPPVKNKFQINSGDLALFMLNELTKNDFVRQKVGISS
ncbi:MAG TPA: hypothetical protein VIY47_04600, partial [Ignavibacteriaceae bacterium]